MHGRTRQLQRDGLVLQVLFQPKSCSSFDYFCRRKSRGIQLLTGAALWWLGRAQHLLLGLRLHCRVQWISHRRNVRHLQRKRLFERPLRVSVYHTRNIDVFRFGCHKSSFQMVKLAFFFFITNLDEYNLNEIHFILPNKSIPIT